MNIPLPKINEDGSYTTPIAGMMIDGDGCNGALDGHPMYAPKGYPGPTPLDFLANAGEPGNWYGVVTVSGNKNGIPALQGKLDPAPGAYISATSYRHPGKSRLDPRAYVDAASVPYIVLPGHWRAQAKGIVLGCKAEIYDKKLGRTIVCGVLDFGPKAKLGEASIAAAKFFGVPSSPKNGGTSVRRFVYRFYPGTPAVIDGVTYQLQPM